MSTPETSISARSTQLTSFVQACPQVLLFSLSVMYLPTAWSLTQHSTSVNISHIHLLLSIPMTTTSVQTPFISHLDCYLKSLSHVSSPSRQFFTGLSWYYLYKTKHVVKRGFAPVLLFVWNPITKNHRPLWRAMEPAGTPSQGWLTRGQMRCRSHSQHCLQNTSTEDWSSISYQGRGDHWGLG